LDVNTAADVQGLLWDLNKEHQTTFVIVTHDLKIARKADRILELAGDGRLKEISGDEIEVNRP